MKIDFLFELFVMFMTVTLNIYYDMIVHFNGAIYEPFDCKIHTHTLHELT